MSALSRKLEVIDKIIHLQNEAVLEEIEALLCVEEQQMAHIEEDPLKKLLKPLQCAWVDEMDPRSSPSDGGRGISIQAVHYDWVIVGKNRLLVSVMIQNRLNVLKNCLTLDKYARLYADLSLIMADYGVQYAGWSPNAERGNDGRKGTREWTGHYNYVKNGGGEDLIKLKLVEKRLNDLCRNLSIEDFANLYAELSVKMAFFGRRN